MESASKKSEVNFGRLLDTGEYRIVYRFIAEEDLVEIILVGKRNDDEVYKKLNRLLK